MSAYGYKRTYSGQFANVRFAPESGRSEVQERVGPKKQTLDVCLAPESGHWHVARKCSHRQDSQAGHASLDTMKAICATASSCSRNLGSPSVAVCSDRSPASPPCFVPWCRPSPPRRRDQVNAPDGPVLKTIGPLPLPSRSVVSFPEIIGFCSQINGAHTFPYGPILCSWVAIRVAKPDSEVSLTWKAKSTASAVLRSQKSAKRGDVEGQSTTSVSLPSISTMRSRRGAPKKRVVLAGGSSVSRPDRFVTARGFSDLSPLSRTDPCLSLL